VKLLLVLGVVLAVLAAALGHLASSGKRSAAAASGPPSLTVAVPADLGKGRGTLAVKRWMKRLTAVCEKRNWDVYELTIRQQSTRPLAPLPYAERVLSSWKEFQRGTSSLRAPASYAAEARWIERVNAAKRQLIEAERDAVLAGDVLAVRSAEEAYRRLSNKTNKGFLMMGLYYCGQFEAQQS
jgi:hypothetical protein